MALTWHSSPLSIPKIQRFGLFLVSHTSCISFSYVPSPYPTSLLFFHQDPLFSVLMFCLLLDFFLLVPVPFKFPSMAVGISFSYTFNLSPPRCFCLLNFIFKILIFFSLSISLTLVGLGLEVGYGSDEHSETELVCK